MLGEQSGDELACHAALACAELGHWTPASLGSWGGGGGEEEEEEVWGCAERLKWDEGESTSRNGFQMTPTPWAHLRQAEKLVGHISHLQPREKKLHNLICSVLLRTLQPWQHYKLWGWPTYKFEGAGNVSEAKSGYYSEMFFWHATHILTWNFLPSVFFNSVIHAVLENDAGCLSWHSVFLCCFCPYFFIFWFWKNHFVRCKRTLVFHHETRRLLQHLHMR